MMLTIPHPPKKRSPSFYRQKDNAQVKKKLRWLIFLGVDAIENLEYAIVRETAHKKFYTLKVAVFERFTRRNPH